MNSQLGLMAVWSGGDWVTRAVALILLAMSLASWIVILVKALDILKYKKLGANTENFWHSEDLVTGLSKIGGGDSNPFHQLATVGREATAHHRNTKVQLHDTLLTRVNSTRPGLAAISAMIRSRCWRERTIGQKWRTTSASSNWARAALAIISSVSPVESDSKWR